MIEVEFRVRAELRVGEEVRVGGNVPALGCNDPQRAVRLYSSATTFPIWTSRESVFVPGDSGSVTYRYCVFSGGRFVRWEGGGSILRPLWPEKSDLTAKTTSDILDVSPQDDLTPVEMARSSSYRMGSQARSFKSRQYAAWARKLQLDGNIGTQDGVIVVSYFLPVILSRSALGQWTATWDEENLLSLQTGLRISWVGSVRYFGAIPVEEEDRVAAALLELNCHPIFINQTMHYKFYDIFCKQVKYLQKLFLKIIMFNI